MIKYILFSGFPIVFLTFSSQNVLAHDNIIPSNAVKASSVISMVQSHGYRNVFDFDYYNQSYMLRAVDKDNEVVKIKVDARTNKIMHVKDTEHHVKGMSYPVSMLDAVKKAEWAGARRIYDVDMEGGSYEILGYTVNLNRVEYLVDAKTGEMRKKM
jgi:phosphatidylserine decarboxylase